MWNYIPFYDIKEYILEDWMSGLNQQFTKLSSWKRLREFESHILRKIRNVMTMYHMRNEKPKS